MGSIICNGGVICNVLVGSLIGGYKMVWVGDRVVYVDGSEVIIIFGVGVVCLM